MHYTFQKILAIGFTAIFLSASVHATQSFIIADNQTGQILQSDSENRKLPVGGLAQLATSLVALDWTRQTHGNSSVMVTIPTVAAMSGSSVGLQPGDTISFRDLVYCTVLASDNVAANTLAEYIGSRLSNTSGLPAIVSFIGQMNALARQLGMSRTLFLNADGADRRSGKQPYSTAADMARLARYAYSWPEFPFYVDQATRMVTVNRMGKLISLRIRNNNALLGSNRIDGAKVSFSPRSGQCLVLTADRPAESVKQGNVFLITPRRLIVVLLGTSNGLTEGSALLQRGWAQYDAWEANGRPAQERASL